MVFLFNKIRALRLFYCPELCLFCGLFWNVLPARAGGGNRRDGKIKRTRGWCGPQRTARGHAVFYCCGGVPAVPFFRSFLGGAAAYRACANPTPRSQRSSPARAHRHVPERQWPKACALARRDWARVMRTGRMGRGVAGASRFAGWRLTSAVTRAKGGAGTKRSFVENAAKVRITHRVENQMRGNYLRTVNTGHVARDTSFCATLPSCESGNAPSPWRPATIRSTPSLLA